MTRVKNKDTKAFKLIVERHQSVIINTVKKMLSCNYQDAENVSQQVFIKVWNAAPRYEEKAQFTTWLFTIMRNLVFNESKKRKKINNIYSIDDDSNNSYNNLKNPSYESPDEKLQSKEIANALHKSIKKLPKKNRYAIILWRYHKLSYTEIASILNTTESSIKSIIFRARKKLKKDLITFLNK